MRFLQDVRYAARSLRRSPGFAIAAILTLALGIGANTAIFSVLEGVVLAPLPYGEPDRLVMVALYNRNLKYATYLSYPDFLDWQRSARSFEQLAAYAGQAFDLTSPGAPEHVAGREVSPGFFSTLGVKPALGRELSDEENRMGGMPAVVISDRLWRDRFQSSAAALGKTITLNGVNHTIVGVLSAKFHLDNPPADVYTPIGQGDPLYRNDRTVHDIGCIARLRRDVSIGQARAEMNTVQEHIGELNPTTERGQGAFVEPLKHFLIGDVGGTLLLMLGAVGLVLLIACANVANLLLARSAGRTREFSVRLALGASRARMVLQLVTESVLLSVVGGAVGLAIAKWGLDAVLAAAPGSIPRIDNIGVNAPVLLFALCISILVGIVFGLLPALKRSNTDLQAGLKEGSRGSTAGHHRTQHVLVVAQIALALVLLTGGSLLVRTIHNLWAVNPGFDARHVITFQVGSPSSSRAAYQQLVERIQQIPGVEAADITALVPLSAGRNEGPFWIGPLPPASMAEIPRAIYYPTGPDYVRTMQIPLLRGRLLVRADNVNSERVVLIDNLLARTYFPDRDAVGQTLTIPHWGAASNVAARIVGVVSHVEQYGLDGAMGEKPQIYFSFYQLPDEALPSFRGDVALAVRTPLDIGAIMPGIKKAVYEPVYNIRTMQELISESMARQRFPMILLSAFAVLALVLACVGIYGVIAYSMTQRVREFGIRAALGALRGDVLRMVLGEGFRLAASGILLGGVAAFILTRMVASFSHLLYGVRPGDPWTFLAVSLVLMGASLFACYIPARRAAQLDPMVALRQDN